MVGGFKHLADDFPDGLRSKLSWTNKMSFPMKLLHYTYHNPCNIGTLVTSGGFHKGFSPEGSFSSSPRRMAGASGILDLKINFARQLLYEMVENRSIRKTIMVVKC